MGFSLDQPAPYRYALFSAAGVLTPGIIALLAIRDSQPQQPQQQLQKTEPLPTGLIAFMAGLGFIGTSAAYAFLTTALILCQQEIIPAEWRATMSGAVIMGRGLGTAAMAGSGGYLIAYFGYPGLFLTGATLAALGTILFWGYTWAPRWLLTRQIAGPTR